MPNICSYLDKQIMAHRFITALISFETIGNPLTPFAHSVTR